MNKEGVLSPFWEMEWLQGMVVSEIVFYCELVMSASSADNLELLNVDC
jgi:hypothetical protein